MTRWLLPVVLASTGTATCPAAADPITDRDYAIDFYDGVAIGNTAWVGMGGAGAANIVGTAGTLINPSAPAVRFTTDTDDWSWDYHIDVLTGKLSTDYDNNGIVSEDAGASLITVGLGGRYHDWAVAVTLTAQTAPVDDTLQAEGIRFRYVIAKYFPARDIAVGIGAQSVAFNVGPEVGEDLFSITGTGLIAGITYVPRMRNFRLAGGIESRILGAEVVADGCDPEDCMGYILPGNVTSPARGVIGFAYRLAPTKWNQLVGGVFRDERALTLTTDLLITGNSPDAYGIEAFAMQELQRSGKDFAISLRGGAEYEWLPGRFRVRAGSYWEPSRFEGVSGRLHVTFGVELRVFEFQLWGRRRGRLSLTGDIAERYRNVAASIGFWH
ncbi:MAG: hypothetical protein ACKV2T_17650 [Kofleriaceae bacterium]